MTRSQRFVLACLDLDCSTIREMMDYADCEDMDSVSESSTRKAAKQLVEAGTLVQWSTWDINGRSVLAYTLKSTEAPAALNGPDSVEAPTAELETLDMDMGLDTFEADSLALLGTEVRSFTKGLLDALTDADLAVNESGIKDSWRVEVSGECDGLDVSIIFYTRGADLPRPGCGAWGFTGFTFGRQVQALLLAACRPASWVKRFFR